VSPGNALCRFTWEDYQTQEEAAKAASEGAARKKGKSASMMTVSMKYRESLNALMTMLGKTHPHFIRCLIPNEQKKSGEWYSARIPHRTKLRFAGMLEAELVLHQLSCNGVLEGIRICRKGFPNRTLHEDFIFRYAILAAAAAKSSPDPKTCSAAIMKTIVDSGQMEEDNFRVGLTKVFFKAGMRKLI
jgi:myosin heavy subunit